MSAAPRCALAVLISGRGSNMVAIAQRLRRAARSPRAVVRVIADRPSAGGIARARAARPRDARSSPAQRLRRTAPPSSARWRPPSTPAARELVVLAGFMRVLSPAFVARYAGRMLNIHPSLLPDYTGLHTHARVLAAGEREHGASVHFVTAELDGGPVVLQARVPVLPGDTSASLSARVQQQEHIIYPEGHRLDRRWPPATGTAALPCLDGQPLARPGHRGHGAAHVNQLSRVWPHVCCCWPRRRSQRGAELQPFSASYAVTWHGMTAGAVELRAASSARRRQLDLHRRATAPHGLFRLRCPMRR